ncbi:hypothetical protein HD806DRAFT_293203 [Xylariaceae sp. AK1471]|nr:hypothetical protein HD806DRAFT_293203 [Xylariaceae sp. AK1471]
MPTHHSQRALVQIFGTYVDHLKNNITRGAKLEFESEYWYQNTIDVERTDIREVVHANGSAVTLVVTELGSSGSDGLVPVQVHLENWTFDSPRTPRLTERCIIHLPVVSDISKTLVAHLPANGNLLTSPKGLGLEEFTALTLTLVSRISATSQCDTSFSANLPWNYWGEVSGHGNIVVLARRTGPRKSPSRSNSFDDLRELMHDKSAKSSSFIAADSTDSDLVVDDSDASELYFSDDHSNSISSSIALSSARVDDEGDNDDPSDFELYEKQPEDVDSDHSIADLNNISQGYCNICRQDTTYRLHCNTCHRIDFDLCWKCWAVGFWCKNERHILIEYTQWRRPTGRNIGYNEFLPDQELLVFDVRSKQRALLKFQSKPQSRIPTSPPVICPSIPLVAWYLEGNRVLLGNYVDGVYVNYQTHSLPVNTKGIFGQVHLSIGCYLHAIILEESIGFTVDTRSRTIDQKRRGIIHYSSHLLNANLPDTPPTLVSHTKLPFKLFGGGSSGLDPPFSVTWSNRYAYITLPLERAYIYRIELQETESKDCKVASQTLEDSGRKLHQAPNLGSIADQSEIVSKPKETTWLPAKATSRMARFIPGIDEDGIIMIGSRNGSRVSLPFAHYLDADTLGPWIVARSAIARQTKHFNLIFEDVPNSEDKELVCDDLRIRFVAAEDDEVDMSPSKKDETNTYMYGEIKKNKKNKHIHTYLSLDGKMTLKLGNGQQDISMNFDRTKRAHYAIKSKGERYAMNLVATAPFAKHEKGTYWRLTSGERSNALETPSSLCNTCQALHLSPSDFVQDSCEEYDDFEHLNVPQAIEKYLYSVLCDACGSKLTRPTISYQCYICNKGGFDLCASCYQKGKHCYDHKHTMQKMSHERTFRDRRIKEFSDKPSGVINDWKGKLGTYEEIRRRISCPLCRLALRSLDHVGPSRRLAGEHSTTPDEKEQEISLHWYEYGWNQERRHVQGRYLVAKKGHNYGTPMVLLSESHPFAPFTAYKLDSNSIHIPTLKSWLKYCEEDHGWRCNTSAQFTNTKVEGFKVIDVENDCLVPFSSLPRFVALSYVWGRGRQFQATKSNIELLQKPGYLKEIRDELSRTMSDAMIFTRQMNERYLWVDALCIVQDDRDSMKTLTEQMDLIYGSSVFTIIAAAGESVEAGLPGVQPGSRRPAQYTEDINATVKLLLFDSAEAKFQRSVHQTRGWTFQETILPRRRFIFLDEMVYFQCEQRICREDFCRRRPNVVSSLVQNADRHTSADAYFGTRSGRNYNPGGIWERLIQAYSKRSLSVQSDILRGIQGIINTVKHRFNLHSIEGMPIEYFDSVLLWAPKRQAKRRAGFLSFSWAGWTGDAVWPAHEGTRHPFISHSLTDSKSWYVQDTYIEWNQCDNGSDPRPLRKSSDYPRYAYSWLYQESNGAKPDMDKMGRPIGASGLEHNDTGKKKGKEDLRLPNPRDSFPVPFRDRNRGTIRPPAETSLVFFAVVVSAILEESVGASKNTDEFHFLSVQCPCGSTHGYVAVPDEYNLRTCSPSRLVVLSNSMPGVTQPFGNDEFQSTKKSKKKLSTKKPAKKSAYHVMLVNSDEGVTERVGLGILERDALICSSSSITWRWDHIFLK